VAVGRLVTLRAQRSDPFLHRAAAGASVADPDVPAAADLDEVLVIARQAARAAIAPIVEVAHQMAAAVIESGLAEIPRAALEAKYGPRRN